MRRQPPILGIFVLLVVALAGCRPQQPFYFRDRGDLSHYIGVASEIDYPDVESATLSEVASAGRPFSLGGAAPQKIWDLKLEDAVHLALENSKVMKSIGGQLQGAPEFLTRSLDQVPTIYDPAIVESNARYGVEAALAAFDTQWTTDVFWEKNNEPQNPYNTIFAQTLFPQTSLQDVAQFQTALTKTGAQGTQYALRHNIGYMWNNSPRLYPSDWTANFEMEVRQPLLQGNGVQFNRIAGPNAIPGFNQGVMLARINTDIALTTFEASVRDMVADVETSYWELYYAYRNLDAALAGRDAAQRTWQKIYALYIVGGRGGEKSTEAQAREQYFLFRSAAEQGLNNLYGAESRLRYLMGLAATDGRLIRPADDPTTAKVAFDWSQTHAEAITRSAEIREAKWRVKSRELELIAAKNYLLPRLDAVARYRWLGLGDDLVDNGNNGGAFENVFSGQHQSWHLELQMQVPIGFRRELSGVRNAQLALSRDRAKLQEIELEVSHQLAFAIRDMDANLALTQTNYNRRIAAERNVEAVRAAYEAGRETIDVLLLAQRLLAQAESDYYRSLTNYNRSIMQVHLRKGSLLEYNGVYLTEGPWPGKAYFDARRRARARDAAIYLDYGFTLPKVVSRGPYHQFAGSASEGQAPGSAAPKQDSSQTEMIPTPEPSLGLPEPSDKPATPKEPSDSQEKLPAGGGWRGKALPAEPPAKDAVKQLAPPDLDESFANPPPAETHRTAPGRTRL